MLKDIQVNDMPWEPHPGFKALLMKKLLSYEQDDIDLSIVLVRVKRGAEIPAHAHEQHDIAYHIEGKGKMWIEGTGDVDVRPGTFLQIPAGLKHQPHDIEEDILVFEIYYPHLF
ncbi:MAG: cupin domain-containing protein [Deltaproteobacteria bacterium]|jgi:quercetin dioxygenase-like cupin family protein